MHSSRGRFAVRWPQAVLLVIVALVIGLFAGGHTGWMPGWIRSAFTSQTAQDQQAESIVGLIRKNYYRPVSTQQLLNKGLEAAVASLDDPYSHYYPPQHEQQFQQETNPQVDGVGIEVSPSRDGLYVDQVFPGGPAARAKIVQGELIVAVNGTVLKGLSVDRASDLIKGKAGTTVSLTLTEGRTRHTVKVKRAEVVEPVASSTILRYKGTKLGYIDFAQFTEGSGDQLRTQVRKVIKEGARGIILDLRDNPGGLVTQAINVASIFLRNGTIVSTRGRNQPTTVYTALGNAIAPTIPLVLVVDRGTASSAEIVTAALQQRGRAKVVGARTYGKGVFQESQTVDGGGILDITVGEFFTPDGKNLGGAGVAQGKDLTRGPGIKPNYYVPDNPDDPGPAALRKAESVLAGEL
jgi:carboxyl-terminal processing protease